MYTVHGGSLTSPPATYFQNLTRLSLAASSGITIDGIYSVSNNKR